MKVVLVVERREVGRDSKRVRKVGVKGEKGDKIVKKNKHNEKHQNKQFPNESRTDFSYYIYV